MKMSTNSATRRKPASDRLYPNPAGIGWRTRNTVCGGAFMD